MRKPAVSISTRTREFTPRELPLLRLHEPPPPVDVRARPPAERITDAVLRWLEEEL
jgi:hypothetical protein